MLNEQKDQDFQRVDSAIHHIKHYPLVMAKRTTLSTGKWWQPAIPELRDKYFPKHMTLKGLVIIPGGELWKIPKWACYVINASSPSCEFFSCVAIGTVTWLEQTYSFMLILFSSQFCLFELVEPNTPEDENVHELSVHVVDKKANSKPTLWVTGFRLTALEDREMR